MRARIAIIVAAFALGLVGCVPYVGGAKPMSPSEVPARYVRAAPTPVVRQAKETDCGLAALAMVAGAWGETWSVSELAARLPPGDKGVKLGALRDLARARGLDAYAIRATPQDLERELAAGRPVVVGLALPYATHQRLGHFEVAVAMDPKDDTLVTQDPATGKTMRRSRKTLDDEWGPAQHAALVVVGRIPTQLGALP